MSEDLPEGVPADAPEDFTEPSEQYGSDNAPPSRTTPPPPPR
ncbi:hypothetical protein [Streptomyces sp. XH2]